MCQIIVKPEGKKVDFKKLDKAQKWNKDGYGVTWWEDEKLNTFKTMDYKRFKAILSTLRKHKAVIHLRNTTRGDTCTDNNHPFEIPSGVMFHNGTINGVSCSAQGGSDTMGLAELISECEYKYIEDILPLVKHIIGDKINRLVFFEYDGEITIVNEDLGMWEDGIWYSNDYHKKEKEAHTSNGRTQSLERENSKKMQRVFVYGTLKKGFGNHRLLSNSRFLGNATTVSKWLMIGEDMPFPYLLEQDWKKGKYIKGELYEVDEATLARLDRLEGVPSHYKREDLYVQIEGSKMSYKAITYVKTTPIAEDFLENLNFIEEFVA
jgi:gamma-glutamylcyclotransferase (GGCT)/AIG2-like uncharacterized protein YtfP/predicted glutamine amidotransferase